MLLYGILSPIEFHAVLFISKNSATRFLLLSNLCSVQFWFVHGFHHGFLGFDVGHTDSHNYFEFLIIILPKKDMDICVFSLDRSYFVEFLLCCNLFVLVFSVWTETQWESAWILVLRIKINHYLLQIRSILVQKG